MPQSDLDPQSTISADSLASTSLLHRAVRNAIFSGLGTIATFALAFVFAGLTIRYLGEARAGYFLTLQALIGLNAAIAAFGLGTPMVRRVAVLYAQNDLPTARGVISSVLIVNVATSLPIALLIILFFSSVFAWTRLDNVYRVDAFYATLFVCSSFVLGQISGAWQSAYTALQRYDLITGLTTVFGLLTGITGIIVLRVAPSMTAVAAAGFGVVVARLLVDAYFMRRLVGQVPTLAWRWNEVRPMLRFGGWSYLGTLGGFLFTNADRLVLTTFLGSTVLPYYVMPQRLFVQIHTSLSGQLQFLFPMFSALGGAASAEIERLEDRLRWFIALVSAAAYTGLGLLGPLILARLVNADFAARAALPLLLVCIQGFLTAQNIYPYYSSWALGIGAPNAIAQIANGVLVIITAIVLIPRVGYLGASIAQLWIGVTVIWHTLWVRSLTMPDSPPWRWLRVYVSPGIMALIWIGVASASVKSVSYGSVGYFVWVAMGGLLALGSVWLVEHMLFAREQRWSTLIRAIQIPLQKIKGLMLARQPTASS